MANIYTFKAMRDIQNELKSIPNDFMSQKDSALVWLKYDNIFYNLVELIKKDNITELEFLISLESHNISLIKSIVNLWMLYEKSRETDWHMQDAY